VQVRGGELGARRTGARPYATWSSATSLSSVTTTATVSARQLDRRDDEAGRGGVLHGRERAAGRPDPGGRARAA
jgi:hypothetical protein